jgi:putative heme-binding domain-containing protein
MFRVHLNLLPTGSAWRAVVAVALLGLFCSMSAAEAQGSLELRDGDRVVLLGDALIENERQHGWIELMLTTRFPDRRVTFQNLGWGGDTPAGEARVGLSQYAAGKEPAGEEWKQLVRQLTEARPTVVLVGYGMASSFAGTSGLAKFEADYLRLLDELRRIDANIRCVLLGPAAHEHLGSPWPDPTEHNAQLAMYSEAIRTLAARRGHAFVSLFDLPGRTEPRSSVAPRSTNGIHLDARGYRLAAEAIEAQLYGNFGAWRSSERVEDLRAAIIRKNDAYHHRWRPNNFVYSFGFLKGHQGQSFRDEITRFEEYVAMEERRIARMRSLAFAEVPVELPPAAPRPATTPAAQPAGSAAPSKTAYGLILPRDESAGGAQPDPKFEVAEGLEVTLWAKNPLLRNPIHMNFDPDGRLWVATSDVYPHLAPGQAAKDQIIVLEDSSGVGRADKATVFADDLLIPTSVEPGDGGVYVTHASELLHLKDTDGDGKADTRRTVLRGFGTEDGHQVVHGLRWGPDGRLYLNQSVYTRSHLETPHGVVRLKAGGIYRLDPRDQRLEVRYRGFVNPWGHQFDDFGQAFVTDGAGHFGINWGIPGATYDTLAPARRTLQSVSAGVYPKYIGIEIIRSPHFPAEWQGDVITSDFRAHTVVRFKLGDQGSGYATREMPPILRSTDQHFRPVDVKLGPDGALYLADWSNPIIQHSGVDFREPRRDREHGRIWRIEAKGRSPLPQVKWSTRSNRELFAALVSPSSYDRERARRVLIERPVDAVTGDLARWLKSRPDEESRLQAVWLYQALNRPNLPLQRELLNASDARIRAAAVRALPADVPLDLLAARVADDHPRVRLEAVRALGQFNSPRALELALSVLDAPMDPFLDYALWLTANELAGPWLEAVKSGTWTTAGREKQLEFVLSAVEPAMAGEVLGRLLGAGAIPEAGSWIEHIGRSGGGPELSRLYEQTLRGSFADTGKVRALHALGAASRLRGALPLDVARGELAGLFTAESSALRLAALQLAGEWRAMELTPALLRVAGEDRTSATESKVALAALRAIGGPAVVTGLARLAKQASSPAGRRDAVVALSGFDFEAALPDVLAVLRETRNPEEAQGLWRELLGVRDAGSKLAAAVSTAELPIEVAKAGLRPAREGNRNPALVDALLKAGGIKYSSGRLSPAELRALAQEAIAKGDAAKGERVYRRPELACVACHAIGGAGGRVGPDLTSIGTSAPPDYLLESLLDPNAQIKQGYHSILVETKDRRQFSGTIARESADEVVLRDAAGGEVIVVTKDIAERASVGSLMPAGLIDALPDDERADLLKFLSMLGRPGEFDGAKSGVARFWKVYAVVSRLQLIPVGKITSGDFTLDDWIPVLSLTNGILPKESLETYIPTRGAPIRGLFAAVQFRSAAGGPATFELSADTKGIWLNGAPVQRGRKFTVQTKPGVNVLVVQLFELDRSRLPEAMRLTSTDVTFLSH